MSSASGAKFWNLHGKPEDGPVPWAWLAILTALAALLRTAGLNDGLWLDEIITLVESVRLPLSRIVSTFPGDNQHTLYSVLAHLSIGVFGEHAWSLRLPAMLIGVATVPMLYVFSRELVGRTEALLASLLLAVNYHHVWFSLNARGYSALACLTLLSSWLVLRGLRRHSDWNWVSYAVVAALGVYTHLTMVFLVISHALLSAGHLGLPRDAERLRRWRSPALGFVLAGILSLLLYSPVLLDVQQAVVTEPSPMAGATAGWAVMELLRGLQIGLGSVLGVLAGIVLFLFGVLSYFRQSPLVLGLFLLPGPITAAAAVALQRPVRPRFFFFLIGFALLIAVRGALEIGRILSRSGLVGRPRALPLGTVLVAVLAVLSVSAIGIESRYPKQDFEGAMRFVDTNRADGEAVATAGGAQYPYRAYYQRDWEGMRSLDELQVIRSRGGRVWVLFTLKSYIARDLMRVLDDECHVARVFPGTLKDGEVTVCTIPPLTRIQ